MDQLAISWLIFSWLDFSILKGRILSGSLVGVQVCRILFTGTVRGGWMTFLIWNLFSFSVMLKETCINKDNWNAMCWSVYLTKTIICILSTLSLIGVIFFKTGVDVATSLMIFMLLKHIQSSCRGNLQELDFSKKVDRVLYEKQFAKFWSIKKVHACWTLPWINTLINDLQGDDHLFLSLYSRHSRYKYT